jgi:hypothetical protein
MSPLEPIKETPGFKPTLGTSNRGGSAMQMQCKNLQKFLIISVKKDANFDLFVFLAMHFAPLLFFFCIFCVSHNFCFE